MHLPLSVYLESRMKYRLMRCYTLTTPPVYPTYPITTTLYLAPVVRMVCRTWRARVATSIAGSGRLRAARSPGNAAGAEKCGPGQCQARLARSVSSATLRSGAGQFRGTGCSTRTFIGAGCGQRVRRRRPPVCKAGAQRGYVRSQRTARHRASLGRLVLYIHAEPWLVHRRLRRAGRSRSCGPGVWGVALERPSSGLQHLTAGRLEHPLRPPPRELPGRPRSGRRRR